MVSEKIKLLEIIEKRSDVLEIVLEIQNQQNKYEVEVIDNHGLFGLELPQSLQDLLSDFPNTEIHRLIGQIKQHYFDLKRSSNLQVA